MTEKRPFRRPDHQITVTLFGAAALAQGTQAEADRTLQVGRTSTARMTSLFALPA